MKAWGWCSRHYQAWTDTGHPIRPPWPTFEERFWSKVDRRGPDECWPWLAGTAKGYGVIDGSRAHRVAYELLVGPIAEGLDLDHQCHNADLTCPGGESCPHRACCNPAHLAEASRAVNVLRGRGPTAVNAVKTHCIHDHELTPENTYFWQGHRYCLTCRDAVEQRRVRAPTQPKSPFEGQMHLGVG